jgi:hypothetical protein
MNSITKRFLIFVLILLHSFSFFFFFFYLMRRDTRPQSVGIALRPARREREKKQHTVARRDERPMKKSLEEFEGAQRTGGEGGQKRARRRRRELER